MTLIFASILALASYMVATRQLKNRRLARVRVRNRR
jgi:hypothetical protein